jgi:hypothetical protein
LERFEADGTRRPLEPGEIAEMDQRSATFRQLRNELLRIQASTVAMVLTDQHDGLREIQVRLYETLYSWYTEHDGANEVFNLVMFLINDLAEAHSKIDRMGEKVNDVGMLVNDILGHLNEAADLAGMITEED